MELAAQYALQIAVNTLQERCKVLSHRVSVLEEENVQLRKSCLKEEETSSLTEIQKLREKVTQLTQEKEQLQEKARMVISENQELWKRLGKLDTVNKYYVEEFNKISETVSQNRTPLQAHTALIRSKTFTQDEPITKCFQKNLELNEKISMELENISLKLSDSFSKQKMELEKFSSELNELKTSEMIGEHLGFGYNENIEDDLFDEFQFVLQDLKVLKSEVVEHKEILRRNAKNLIYLCKESVPRCKTCLSRNNCYLDKSTWTQDLPKMIDKFTDIPAFSKNEYSNSTSDVFQNVEKMCPVCSRLFRKDVPFTQFQEHVEDHFAEDSNSFEVI